MGQVRFDRCQCSKVFDGRAHLDGKNSGIGNGTCSRASGTSTKQQSTFSIMDHADDLMSLAMAA